jgi:hypothetical protein
VHVAVWPAPPIVPLHPSENVVVSGAITETVSLPESVTYKSPLSGLKAMSIGLSPTGMVSVTVFVDVSITETVPLAKFATYIKPLSGLKAMSIGFKPTGMGALLT